MLDGFAGGIQPWWHLVSAYDEDRRIYRTAEPILRWHAENQQYLINACRWPRSAWSGRSQTPIFTGATPWTNWLSCPGMAGRTRSSAPGFPPAG